MDKNDDPDAILETEYTSEESHPVADAASESSESSNAESQIKIVHRAMLQEKPEPKEDEDDKRGYDEDHEKPSIERASAYDQLALHQHYVSKPKLEADEEFEEQMQKVRARERAERERIRAEEERRKAEEEKRAAEKLRKEALSFNFAATSASAMVPESVRRQVIKNSLPRESATNELADDRLARAITGVIALEIATLFIAVPNQIFIFPPIVQLFINAISVMLVFLSIILLLMAANNTEGKKIPLAQQKIFIWTSILPRAMLRVALADGLAYLLSFAGVPGAYIGFICGLAIASYLHYIMLTHYKIQAPEWLSIIISIITILILIIPSAISGTVSQPIDPEGEYGFAVFAIEGALIVIIDEAIFKIHEYRDMRRHH